VVVGGASAEAPEYDSASVDFTGVREVAPVYAVA